MSEFNVYSSAPLSTQLAVAFQGLKAQGQVVTLRPLSELPSAAPRRQHAQQLELEHVCQRLVAIGQVLEGHQDGRYRLGAGEELGLRADRDALLSRKRGLEASLRAQEGGPANG